jgi:hypothetical protein
MKLSLFSIIAQFGTAEDVALADLKIEMMFPADDAMKEFLIDNFASPAGRQTLAEA